MSAMIADDVLSGTPPEPQKQSSAQVAELSCPFSQDCMEYVKSLGLEHHFAPDRIRCFAPCCYTPPTTLLQQRGDPPCTYAIPVGWLQIGIRCDATSVPDGLWTSWNVGFHGTYPAALQTILSQGRQCILPGQQLVDSTSFALKRNSEQRCIYASPSVKYASLSACCPTIEISEMKHAQLVTKLRIEPASFTPQAESVGWMQRHGYTRIDPLFSNDGVEYCITTPATSTFVTSILVKVWEETKPRSLSAPAPKQHSSTAAGGSAAIITEEETSRARTGSAVQVPSVNSNSSTLSARARRSVQFHDAVVVVPISPVSQGSDRAMADGAEPQVLILDEPALVVAARRGDLATVRTLLSEGQDSNARGAHQLTALMLAAEHGHSDVVTALLEHGAAVDLEGDAQVTALTLAAAKGDFPIVQMLVQAGANVNHHTQSKDTALIKSAKQGAKECVDLLLKNAAKPDVQNESGATALLFAAAGGFVPIVDMLLLRGANPHLRDAIGESPISFAALKGHGEIVWMLLASGVNPDVQDDKLNTPLMCATNANRVAVVEILLKAGANPNLVTRSKMTALMLASWRGYMECVQMLLEHKADVNVCGEDNVTSLLLAADHGHADVVETLLNHGAFADAQTTKHQDTAMMLAINKDHDDVVQALLSGGANANIANITEDTALHVAAHKSKKSVVEMLLKAGADPTLRDKRNLAPRDVAKDREIAKILRESELSQCTVQ